MIVGILALCQAKWGTFKPNLYFALKDAEEVQQVGLMWIVEDWRTGKHLVRHRV